MRKLSLLAAIAVTVSSVSPIALAQAPAAVQPPRIVATGTGEARVNPDRATIFIGVQTRATTAAAAAAENARRQRAVTDTLRAAGLADDQISTMNYNVSPEMQYAPNQSPRVTGYSVSNTVRVEVRRIDDVGKFIDAALAKGSNTISGLQFFSSKSDSVRRAALTNAIANARADADAMAKAAGGSLGPLIELSSEPTVVPRMEMAFSRAGVAGAQVMPTQIDPGVQTVNATVHAQWAFIGR